jgi:hypothetical protein
MATLAQKIRCEKHAREMLQREGLPDPDRVEYGHTCIRLFWEHSKVVMVVDIDDPPEGLELLGEYPEDFEDEADLDDLDDEDVAEILRRLDHDDDDETEEAA